jgi:hypothetical protein
MKRDRKPWSDDEGLARLLGAAGAEADPAVWLRVKMRLGSEPPAPAWLAWMVRPVALAAAGGALALSLVAGLALVRAGALAPADENAGVLATLIGDADPTSGVPGLDVEAGSESAGEADSSERP